MHREILLILHLGWSSQEPKYTHPGIVLSIRKDDLLVRSPLLKEDCLGCESLTARDVRAPARISNPVLGSPADGTLLSGSTVLFLWPDSFIFS